MSIPCSSRIRTASPTTRCAATSKPAVSKICEPMCECSPAKFRSGQAITRRTASSAAPEASEKPNFWSSCAVAMNSCVVASTPVVTRTRTFGVTAASSARKASLAISSNESATTWPMPAPTARASSPWALLLPCMVICRGGTPADSATSSSPPVHTSTPSPSELTQRSIARQQNAFAA